MTEPTHVKESSALVIYTERVSTVPILEHILWDDFQ